MIAQIVLLFWRTELNSAMEIADVKDSTINPDSLPERSERVGDGSVVSTAITFTNSIHHQAWNFWPKLLTILWTSEVLRPAHDTF